MFLAFIKYLFLFILASIVTIFFLDRFFRSEGYHGPVSDHFNGKTFFNKESGKDLTEKDRRGGFAMFKWLISRDKNVWVKRDVTQTKPVERVFGSEIVATYINHATVLIQTEGLNIITDPIYSERASPVQWLGPRRYSNPGVAFGDLPPIDFVLISHNHYDHMDLDTLRRLQSKFDPKIITHLGNSAFLEKKGIDGAIDLDWWQSYGVITSAPSQHFSARSLSDRNKNLWGGYVIKTSKGNIYFAGDTGYGPFVKEIAKKYPDGFRFAMLPIGAYEPAWIMSDVHINPDEAFQVKSELKILEVLAIHFGTFKLADDKQDQPADRVKEILSEMSVKNPELEKTFHVIKNGESVKVSG